ncbi:MAG: CorA family divalent cation transporter [Hyphomicrobium sp.]
MDQIVHSTDGAESSVCSASVISDSRRVRHFRQILLWPVRLSGGDGGPIKSVAELIKPGSPWKVHTDEYDDPKEFRERHYHELVTFLPPVRRFLYGEGAGAGTDDSLAIQVLRRCDVAGVRVTLSGVTAPLTLDVAHIDLYVFEDVDVAMLIVEVSANDAPLDVAQEAMFQFGRTYPSKWLDNGRAAHCPRRVEWLAADGAVLEASDYDDRSKFLRYVCLNRGPLVAAHWDFLFNPIEQHNDGAAAAVQYKLLEGNRVPLMAFLGMEDPNVLTRADYIRLAYASGAGDSGELPFVERHLADFEANHCYDRYDERRGGADCVNLRFMSTEMAFVVTGRWGDSEFSCPERGYLGQFRHQQFLLFLIAHFQKAALLMFSDRLAGAVNKLDISSPKAVLDFRSAIRLELERFLRFTHRYWFHAVSNHELDKDLFALTRRHLELDRLYEDVRAEIEEMSQFLETEALRRQNDSMMRLTVVTIFGLIWTIVTGFLGMNLFDHTALTAVQKAGIFLLVLLPTIALMTVAVAASRRLSAFLDWLSGDPTQPRRVRRPKPHKA